VVALLGVKNREDISEDRIATHQSSSALDTIEAGNEWPVHIAVVVLLAVEESRDEETGIHVPAGSWINVGDY
jgi:DNA polymerase II large subunit